MKPREQSKCPQQGSGIIPTADIMPVLRSVNAYTALGTRQAHLSVLYMPIQLSQKPYVAGDIIDHLYR